MNSRIPFLVISIILVITLMWFGLYYVQASSTIATDNATITSLTGRNTSLEAALIEANSRIVSLTTQLNAANTQISALREQLTAAKAQSSTLQTQLEESKTQARRLQANLETANTQITALQNQASSLQASLNTANSQITALQSQVTSLQTQLDTTNATAISLQSQLTTYQAITSLTLSAPVASAVSVNATSAANVTVGFFVANYAGYVTISGSSSDPTGFIRVTNTFPGYPHNNVEYAFGTSNTTLAIPVLPGSVIIAFGAKTASSTTATVSITYIY